MAILSRKIPYRRRSRESYIDVPLRITPAVKRKPALHEIDAAPVVLDDDDMPVRSNAGTRDNAPPRWWDSRLDAGLKPAPARPGVDVPGARPRASKVAVPKRPGGAF